MLYINVLYILLPCRYAINLYTVIEWSFRMVLILNYGSISWLLHNQHWHVIIDELHKLFVRTLNHLSVTPIYIVKKYNNLKDEDIHILCVHMKEFCKCSECWQVGICYQPINHTVRSATALLICCKVRRRPTLKRKCKIWYNIILIDIEFNHYSST